MALSFSYGFYNVLDISSPKIEKRIFLKTEEKCDRFLERQTAILVCCY